MDSTFERGYDAAMLQRYPSCPGCGAPCGAKHRDPRTDSCRGDRAPLGEWLDDLEPTPPTLF